MIALDKKSFGQVLDSIKLIIGVILLGYGFYNNSNQFLMGLGGLLIAISGIEIKVGKLNLNSPSRKSVK